MFKEVTNQTVIQAAILALVALVVAGSPSMAEETAGAWFTKQTTWHDHPQFHFKVNGQNAWLVEPKVPAEGKPWIWRARFPGFHNEMDITLVKQGFHLAYVDVANLFGGPKAMEIGDAFYQQMTAERKLAKRVVLEGVSRGGLLVYNWAARHPERVACIYCDTPVLDIKSWPGGHGDGVGSAPTWRQCLAAYNLTDKQATTFDKNPIDHAAIIAKAEIPILHIVSENDRIVPPQENTYVLQQRLKANGHSMEIISVPQGTEKSRGHHFTHPDPARVVKFINKHGR